MNLSAVKTFEEKKSSIFQSIGINNTRELPEIECITDTSIIKKLIKVDPSLEQKTQEAIYEILKASGVLLKAHFQLLSGKHSEYFIRFSKLSRNTRNLKTIAKVICDQIIKNNLRFDIVLSPETAASSLAVSISRLLIEKYDMEIETIYAKTDDLKRPTSLLNWIDLKAGSKVLLVNDLITSGFGITELVRLTERYGGDVTGICVFTYRIDAKKIELLRKKYAKFFFSVTDSSELDRYTYDDTSSCHICRTSKAKPIPSRYLN